MIPKFVVKVDVLEDKMLFQKCICDKDTVNVYPFMKNSIFRIFPELKDKIENENSKEMQLMIINDFVEGIYGAHKNKITQIKENLENQISGYADVIYKNIGRIMEYDFKKDSVYEIYISFSPFSTYGKNKAGISILDDIGGHKKTPFMDIIIHELSHAVLEEQFDRRKITTSPLIFNMLKEIFAPILLRNASFKDIIQSEESKKGNPEQYYLQIKKDNKIYNIVDFFEEIYLEKVGNGEKFFDIMKEFIGLMESKEDILKEKDDIFKLAHKGEYMRSKQFKEKLENAHYLDPIIL